MILLLPLFGAWERGMLFWNWIFIFNFRLYPTAHLLGVRCEWCRNIEKCIHRSGINYGVFHWTSWLFCICGKISFSFLLIQLVIGFVFSCSLAQTHSFHFAHTFSFACLFFVFLSPLHAYGFGSVYGWVSCLFMPAKLYSVAVMWYLPQPHTTMRVCIRCKNCGIHFAHCHWMASVHHRRYCIKHIQLIHWWACA